MKRNHLFIGLAGVLVGLTLAWAAAGDIVVWRGKGSRRNTVEFSITSPTVGTAANIVPGTNNTNSLGVVTASEMKSGYFASFLGIPSNAAPRTNVTPERVGQLIYNSTGGEVCVSTGTTASTWTKASGGTACAN